MNDSSIKKEKLLPLKSIPSNEVIIQQTQKWVDTFIIHHNICPFAKNVVDKQQIDYQVINERVLEDCLLALFDQLMILKATDTIKTALVIFPIAVNDFDRYLDFLAIANQLIEDQKLDSEFQLASFHPQYCFEGVEDSDASNYTNRAPWPMVHLLRQSSIEKGLQYYQSPEQIPENNIKLTRELGSAFLMNLRKRCFDVEGDSTD